MYLKLKLKFESSACKLLKVMYRYVQLVNYLILCIDILTIIVWKNRLERGPGGYNYLKIMVINTNILSFYSEKLI